MATAYELRLNATCPRCGKQAEKHAFPAAKNHGHGFTEYYHEVRKGMFGFREIVKSCTVKEA